MQLQLLVCAYVYCGDPEGEKTKEIVQRRKTPQNKNSHEYSAITESTSGTCCRQGRKTDIEGGMGGEVRHTFRNHKLGIQHVLASELYSKTKYQYTHFC